MSWDTFLGDAEAASGTNYQKCGMATLFESLDGPAVANINAALNRPELTSAAIMAAIKQRVDTKVSEYTLRRHRKGACSCPRNG